MSVMVYCMVGGVVGVVIIFYFVDQYNNSKIEICISLEKLCTFSLYPIFCRYGVLNCSKLENIVLFAD